MTKEKILEALGNVQEPDLGKDIVTLNMVKDLAIDGQYVSFHCCIDYAGMSTERHDSECMHQCD